jgi:hypothetical protein
MWRETCDRIWRHRRRILFTAAAILITSAAHRTQARAPNTDIEATGYGGANSGGWTCGPTARAKYVGAAVNVTISEHGRYHEEGPGLLAVAGAAIERETVEGDGPLQFDNCPARDTNCSALPPPSLLGAVHGRIGGGWRWFGIELGALGYQGWSSNTSQTPKWTAFPELEVRVGPPAVFYGVLGFGSDLPTTTRRPAILYTGIGGTYESVAMDLRIGFNRAGPAIGDDYALRTDVLAKIEIVPDIFIAPALAAQFPDRGSTLGWEGSLGVKLAF